jgi:hypothetical protein
MGRRIGKVRLHRSEPHPPQPRHPPGRGQHVPARRAERQKDVPPDEAVRAEDEDLARHNTRPAMADSFSTIAGSRFSGAVRIAYRARGRSHGGRARASPSRPGKPRHHGARLVGVAGQDRDDLGDVDLAVIRVPAVVIGDHGDGGVAKLRLAGELGLGHVGHPDHVAAPDLAVELRFREARELRPLHGEVGATVMHRDPGIRAAVMQAADRRGQVGCATETWATSRFRKSSSRGRRCGR